MSVSTNQSRMTFTLSAAALAGIAASITMDASAHMLPESALVGTARVRLPDVATALDEPITPPAVAPAAAQGANSVFAQAASLSVMPGVSLGVSSGGDDTQSPGDENGGYASAKNFRGDDVTGATTRYTQDFETGEIGKEWGAFGGVIPHETLTAFANPAASGGMTLNVSTKEGEVYEIRMDVYLVPPAGSTVAPGKDEDAERVARNVLGINVDGQMVYDMNPVKLSKLGGATPVPGQPLKRQVRFNFTSTCGIAEIHFTSPPGEEGAWSTWGVDNLVIDLGLQDPTLGAFGGDFDTDIFGLLAPPSDLNGELPPLPRSRYGSNEPISNDSTPSSSGGPKPVREIPSPGPLALVLGAAACLLHRRR